jgi:acyl carrier protein
MIMDIQQTAVEMARIWCDVLGVGSVTGRDNFFELGGHSLLAIKLICEIDRRFNVELPVTAVYAAPTLDELCQAVDGTAPSTAGQAS